MFPAAVRGGVPELNVAHPLAGKLAYGIDLGYMALHRMVTSNRTIVEPISTLYRDRLASLLRTGGGAINPIYWTGYDVWAADLEDVSDEIYSTIGTGITRLGQSGMPLSGFMWCSPNGATGTKWLFGVEGSWAVRQEGNSYWMRTFGGALEAAGAVVLGEANHIGFVWDPGNFLEVWVNGAIAASDYSFTDTSSTDGQLEVGLRLSTTAEGFNGGIKSVMMFDDALSKSEVESLHDPETRWGLWETPLHARGRRRTYYFPDAAGDTSLSGSATGAATVAAQLTTAITLGGAATADATPAADITTQIRMGASALAAASVAAQLTTAITLTGGASASVTPAAALSTGISLSGSATATAAASGALAGDIVLAGQAAVSATASASLDTSIRMSGAAAAAGAVAAQLSTGITLSGGASASATAAGDLSSGGAQLVGSAESVATVAAQLATGISLSGLATANAATQAALTAGLGIGEVFDLELLAVTPRRRLVSATPDRTILGLGP